MPIIEFKGKTFVQNHHLAVKHHQLMPKSGLSLTDRVSLHDNLIVQGDNLKALKALLSIYAGRVNCIYIDPPYNTGNEGWVYNDRVASPMIAEWLGREVDTEDMTRHDKWLCMMWPRLRLLHELMAEDGVIFISCDDNEQHRLRMIMDEIFGEGNFVASFVVIRAEGGGLAKQVIKGHDYCLVYAKNISEFTPIKRKKDIRGKVIVKDGKEYWLEEDWLRIEFGKWGTCYYEDIEKHKGENKKREIEAGIKNDIYRLVKKGNGKHVVARLRDVAEDGSKFYSIIKHLSANGIKTAKDLKLDFDYPKPISLVRDLIKGATFSSDKKNAIILDSFAGSGTTAHAVLDLNKEDGGCRRFILIECEGYADSITAERVRRVIKGVPESKNFRQGTGGTFSYFALGDAIKMRSILQGNRLPSYTEFARYLFYTATGEELNVAGIREKTNFVGESRQYEVYLFYRPSVEWLRNNALTLDHCKGLPPFNGKQRLVYAPAKYVDDHSLRDCRVDFCQLPYEIYKMN